MLDNYGIGELVFKIKFISYMIGKTNTTEEHALLEYEAIKDDIEDDECPYYLANECISCWEAQ